MQFTLEPLYERLSKIENLLSEIQRAGTNEPPLVVDQPMSIKEAAKFLSISTQTIYQNISKIPHRKRFGKLYFFRDELMSYLEEKTT